MSQPADRKEILRRHEAGDRHTVIAADYGISRDQVRQIVKAEGGEPRRPARPLSAATAAVPAERGLTGLPDWRAIPKSDLRTILAGYCDEQLTAQAISDKFTNCSRSAVIGQVYRFKLELSNGKPRRGGKAKPAQNGAALKAKPRASKLVQQTSSWRGANNPPASDFKARAEQREKSPGLPAHLVAGVPRRPVCDLVPVSRKLALTDLTDMTCRWPNGDPLVEGFGFCGNEATSDGPYCRYHARLASAPPTHRLSVPRGA